MWAPGFAQRAVIDAFRERHGVHVANAAALTYRLGA